MKRRRRFVLMFGEGSFQQLRVDSVQRRPPCTGERVLGEWVHAATITTAIPLLLLTGAVAGIRWIVVESGSKAAFDGG